MMIITYARSYYGKTDPAAIPPPALVLKAESTVPMLHPERTHVWAVTEPNLTWAPQLRGPIGWIVTFTPQPPTT
jgi:hypothetical protein